MLATNGKSLTGKRNLPECVRNRSGRGAARKGEWGREGKELEGGAQHV